MQRLLIGALLVLVMIIGGCEMTVGTYNNIAKRDNDIDAKWATVLSTYKLRSDLVPNLVEIVKGYASQEASVLQGVTEARAKATQITLPSNATPEQIAAYGAAQKELSAGLGRLLAVSENYPDLKSNQNFLKLQSQLSNIESQANAARNSHIRSIQAYNINVTSVWGRIVASVTGYQKRPQATFDDEGAIKIAPKIEFKK